MYSSLIWIFIISIASIYLAHRIWDHFKQTYTSQKTKHLVEIQTNKYKQMVEELTKQSKPLNLSPNTNSDFQKVDTNYLNPEEKQWMVQQLEEFVFQNRNS
jgi:flagellar biosynthesis component FlhA